MATFEKSFVESYSSLEAFAREDGGYKIYESDTNYHTVRRPEDEAAILGSRFIKNPRQVWPPLPGAVDKPNLALRERPDSTTPLWKAGGPIRAVAISSDATLLAAACAGEIRLWDFATQEELGEPLVGHRGAIFDLTFSPDSAHLASVGADGSLRLWNVGSSAQDSKRRWWNRRPKPNLPLEGHTSTVRTVAFAPSGDILATTSDDKTTRLWDFTSRLPLGEPIVSPFFPHGAVFLDDGATLLIGGDTNTRGTVQLWSVKDRRQIVEGLPAYRHNRLAVDPKGRVLACGGDLWDLTNRERITYVALSRSDSPSSVAFKPDSSAIAFGDARGVIHIFGLDGQQLQPPLTGHREYVWGLAFGADGATLASCGHDGTLRIWDLSDPQNA